MSPATRRFRAWNSFTHTWIGIIFGLFFALMGATGALISLQPEIEWDLFPSSNSQVVCLGDPALINLEQTIAAVTAKPVERVYLSASSDPRIHLRLRGDDSQHTHLVYDSCTGELLGPANLAWLDWTVDLHHNFLAGKTGRKVIGVIGILLFINAFAGLALWLLTKPKISHLWSLPPRPGAKAFSYYFHRSVGLVAMAFLLLEAGTGVFLSFPFLLEQEARPKLKRDNAPLLPVDQYLNAARQIRPNAKIRQIRLQPDGGPVSIEFWQPGFALPAGDGQISLGRADAALLRVSNKPVLSTITWLHFGQWGAAASRYLAAILGLTPLVLFASGFLIWWLPKLAARRRKVITTIPQQHEYNPRSYPA